jgi:transposase InsO family protein
MATNKAIPQFARNAEALHAGFPNLFSGKLGKIKDVQVKLNIDDTVRPVRQAQRPIPFHLRAPVEKQLLNQESLGIIERVTAKSGPTPWVANLVIVDKDNPRKKNTKCTSSKPSANQPPEKEIRIRLTSDNRAQNKAIRRTKYPCKTVEDIIYLVNGAKVFSKLDIYKAYHQAELHPDSKYLTTTTSHIGLWQHNRLHMGISSAQEIFTEIIRTMLEDLPGQVNMTDDILVFGATAEEHHENLLKVLNRLEEKGLTLNKEKCEFYKDELTFFGMRFSKDGVDPTIDRCQALWDAKNPDNAKDLHSFLCTVIYNSRFIQDLCTIAEPLWQLTKEGVKWEWLDIHDKAMLDLKNAISTKCMAYFNINWCTEIICDASPVGLGAVLCQYNPKNHSERSIVCFASRMLTELERKQSQVEKEAMAVCYGPERFAIYVLGSHFTIVTDNRAVQLIFSNTKSKPPPRIERLALKMSAFNCTFVHRPGKGNIADYYSRYPSKNNTGIIDFLEELRSDSYVNSIVVDALPAAMTLAQIENATAKDDELQKLKLWILASPQPKLPHDLLQYKHVQDELSCTSKGILLRGSTIIIPNSLRSHILDLAHCGHQGIVKTKSLIRSRVWFPGLDQLVEHRIKNCIACQANSDRQAYAPLKPSEMPPAPWHTVSGDLYGPMDDGRYWFVNYCEYTKWASVEIVKSVSQDAIEPILVSLFDHFGVPVEYKTDNGSPFQSARFASFAVAKGFKHRKITPEWPRANGGAESFMKKLGKIVRIAKITGENKYDLLKDFLRRYRETPHTTTKVAPSLLLLGHSRSSGIPQLAQPYNQLKLHDIHAFAQRNHALATARMKLEYDTRMRALESNITVGSLVLIKLKKVCKTTPTWDPDPYRVININGTQITAQRHDRTTTRNSSFFKLYRVEEFDSIISDETRPTALSSASTQSPPMDIAQPSDESNFSRSGEETGRQVSFSNEIVIINDAASNNNENIDTESPNIEAQVTEPNKGKGGRPTKEQSIINAENRKKAEEERKANNPPLRASSRLGDINYKSGRM